MTQAIGTCPIWGSEFRAELGPNVQIDKVHVLDSPRAGGGYQIDRDLLPAQVPSMSGKEKARLTTWLVDQRLQGNRHPQVTREVIELAINKRPLPVHERAERLLRLMASSADKVADRIQTPEGSLNRLRAYAWSESVESNELDYLADYLEEMGWIRNVIRSLGRGPVHELVVSVAGHSRIAEAETNVDSSQAFVAMWFDPQMDDAYDHGIKLAIEDAGYKPLRIDRQPDVNKIDDEIIAGIRKSRFLVADFTQGEDGARGAVYFEAGFASGLGLRFIYTCRKDKVKELAFDTRQYNHIIWETPDDLRTNLKNRIEAWIGKGPETP